MHRYPAAAAYAHGAYLAFTAFYGGVQPNTCLTGATLTLEAIIGQRAYYHLLQAAQVPAKVGFKMLQVKYRVAHYLFRPVKCNVTTAVYMKIFNAFFSEVFFAQQYIGWLSIFAKCIFGIVLSKQQPIYSIGCNAIRFASIAGSSFYSCIFLQKLFLVIPGLLISRCSQVTEYHFFHPGKDNHSFLRRLELTYMASA